MRLDIKVKKFYKKHCMACDLNPVTESCCKLEGDVQSDYKEISKHLHLIDQTGDYDTRASYNVKKESEGRLIHKK